jgi:uncharacterized protein (UPF0128 family)
MRAFSEAMVNGVHVMDLPDAPQKKPADEMSDEMATMMYSEQVNDKTQEEETKNT